MTYLGSEPDTSLLQCLSLGLVYGSGKGGSHWELSPMPLEGVLTNCRNEGDPWEEDCSESTNDLTL